MDIKTERKRKQIQLLAITSGISLLLITAGIFLSVTECEYITATGWLPEAGRILSSVTIIFLAWVLISVLHKYAGTFKIIIIGFAVIYIAGISVYKGIEFHESQSSVHPDKGVSVLSPINNTLSVFFPSRGAYSEEMHNEASVPYQLFHLFAYFFFALIAFSFFGRRALNRSGHLLIGYKHKNIFWEYSTNGKVLAQSILHNSVTDQAIFILPDDIRYTPEEDNRIFNEINDIGAIALYVDPSKMDSGSRSLSGYRHFFLSEDQDLNIRMALRILDTLIKKGVPSKTHLYIRCELENIDIFFEEKIKERNISDTLQLKLKNLIEFHIYNHSDLTARQFVARNPVLKHNAITIDTEECTAKGNLHILLLGFGWTGYELLKKIICDSQFDNPRFSLSVTVIDKDYNTKHGRYKYILQQGITHGGYDIRFNPDGISEVNSQPFYDWLQSNNRIIDFNRIIIALGEDSLNVNTAIELNRFRLGSVEEPEKYEKIFAHVRDYSKYNYYTHEKSPIQLFGGLGSTNCCNVLVDETMDRIAKMVNFVYSRYDVEKFTDSEFHKFVTEWQEIENEWAKASVFNQNSSRAVAMNIGNMVSLSGGEDNFTRNIDNPLLLESYARYEHLRWNAFHYMNGIKCWDMEEVTAKNGKLQSNGILIRHICLIPYEKLDEASAKVNTLRTEKDKKENYKNTDRRIIKHFPLFLKYKDTPGNPTQKI